MRRTAEPFGSSRTVLRKAQQAVHVGVRAWELLLRQRTKFWVSAHFRSESQQARATLESKEKIKAKGGFE